MPASPPPALAPLALATAPALILRAACTLAHCLQLPWWLQWLQRPQREAPSWQQKELKAEARRQAEEAEFDQELAAWQELLDSDERDEKRWDEWVQKTLADLERQKRKTDASGAHSSNGQPREAAASGSPTRGAAPPAPPPAGPWPGPAPSQTPAAGPGVAWAAAAEASAAAATAWAAVAVGHEAAAEATAECAQKQPATHAATAATEWGRAAAAWRAAYDALEAAIQADPGAEAVQQATVAVEAARSLKRQLRDVQG